MASNPDNKSFENIATKYWYLKTDPKHWSFSKLKVGESEPFTSYTKNGTKKHIYQYYQEAESGNLAIGYETSPTKQIAALCKIKNQLYQSKQGEAIEVEKIEDISGTLSLQEMKEIPELSRRKDIINGKGSLFKLTKKEFTAILYATKKGITTL